MLKMLHINVLSKHQILKSLLKNETMVGQWKQQKSKCMIL